MLDALLAVPLAVPLYVALYELPQPLLAVPPDVLPPDVLPQPLQPPQPLAYVSLLGWYAALTLLSVPLPSPLGCMGTGLHRLLA